MNIKHLLLRFRNKLRIKPNNQVHISDSIRMRYCSITINGLNNTLVLKSGVNLKGVDIEIVGNNCHLEIDENCVIGEQCFISCRENGTRLSIGRDCMFSRNVKIMTSDGHDIYQGHTRINTARSISIGNHVWLADNCTILKGVTIGNGSIVGMNATVTKNVPDSSIATGNPARVIKNDIHWDEALTF